MKIHTSPKSQTHRPELSETDSCLKTWTLIATSETSGGTCRETSETSTNELPGERLGKEINAGEYSQDPLNVALETHEDTGSNKTTKANEEQETKETWKLRKHGDLECKGKTWMERLPWKELRQKHPVSL